MKAGVLRVTWSRRQRDHVFHYPSSPDGHLTNGVLCSKRRRSEWPWDQSFMDELVVRGYDVTTFRMRVERYRHAWIRPGATLRHRQTGEERHVHHVRWERGVGHVFLVARRTDMGAHLEDVTRSVLGDRYLPIADVERDWQCRPGEHPRSWLSQNARAAIRPDCNRCGARRKMHDGALVCPKCSAEGRKPNTLIDALMNARPS